MAKYEPKTCITCRHRHLRVKTLFDGSKSFVYVCYERIEIGKRILEVSGRHLKCEKYERRQK